MTRRSAAVFALIGAAVLLASVTAAPSEVVGTAPRLGIRAHDPQVFAFTGATVVIAPGQVMPDATLLARDGRVVAVASGPSLRIPPDAEVIDLEGRWIFPGFVDPVTEYGLGHVGPLNPARPPGSTAPQYEGTGSGANAWNDAIHSERDWVAEFEPDAKQARRWLERGYTVVQSAKLDGIFRGRSFVTSLRPGLPNEVVLRPHGLHFASFDRGSSTQSYPESLMGAIALIRQTLLDAQWYTQAHQAASQEDAKSRPEFNRAIAALAGNDGPLLFASRNVHDLLRAARIGEELGLPLIHFGSNTEIARLDEVAVLDAPVILPLDFEDPPPLVAIEDERTVMLSDLRRWERAPYHPALLHEAGVEIAFTTHGLDKDADLFERVRRAIRRGLPSEAALAALTTVPARLCGVDETTGTLLPGRAANFFVADRDLLAERGEVLAVWIDGRRVFGLFPESLYDFRGEWRFTLEGESYELRLGGTLSKPEGKLVRGEDSSKLAAVEPTPTGLDFQVTLDEPGVDGIVRFRLSPPASDEIGEIVPGRATLPDGRVVPLTFERLAQDESPDGEEEKEEEEDVEQLRLISRRTLPDSPFGFETLPEPRDVLVRDATLWTVTDEGLWEGGDMLVQDGRIVAVADDIEPPNGVTVIDGRGLHVTPGIIDEHSHIAIAGDVNEGTHAVTSEVRIEDVLDAEDVAIYRALAGGVTTAQLLHGSANPIGGQAQVIKLRWGQSPDGLRLDAAPPTIKFALGENVKQSNWGERYSTRYPQTRMGVETLMRDAFLAARAYREEWDEWRALGASARRRAVPPRRDLQLEALDEILRGERFVHCHSYVQSEILSLMRLAESLGFRIQTFTHILEGYKVAGEMAEHGASASAFADWWAYKFEVYDAIPYNTCLMHERGLVVSVNSDSAEMMRRLNQEAAKSVHYCQMGNMDAMALVTLNPARQLRIDDRVGSLAPGKDADFVIWDGHPLSVQSKVVETWIEGVPYFSAKRDAELREAAQRERAALVQKALGASRKKDRKKNEGKNGGDGGGRP